MSKLKEGGRYVVVFDVQAGGGRKVVKLSGAPITVKACEDVIGRHQANLGKLFDEASRPPSEGS